MGAFQSRRNRIIRHKALESRARNPSISSRIRRYEKTIYGGLWDNAPGIFGITKRCSETYPHHYHVISALSEDEWDDTCEDTEDNEEERPLILPAHLTHPSNKDLKGWKAFRKKFQWNFQSPAIFMKNNAVTSEEPLSVCMSDGSEREGTDIISKLDNASRPSDSELVISLEN